MTVTKTQKAEFLRWYEAYHERFARYCASKAFGLYAAEDLMQEAILATLAQWGQIRDKNKLLSYMTGVVNNILRNQRRRLPFQADWNEKRFALLEGQLDDPAQAVDVDYLLKAMDQLPTHEQQAIELFEISGFSVKEVAAIQQVSEGAVKTRLSRARKRLRELLSEDGSPLTIAQRLQIYASIIL